MTSAGWAAAATLALWALPACEGPAGAAGANGGKGENGATGAKGETGETGAPGAIGAPGTEGDDGTAGPACWDLDANGVGDPAEDTNGDGTVDVLDCRGADAVPATPVGRETCRDCHSEIYDRFLQSGHAQALLTVNGARPETPFSVVPATPPTGHTWDDVAYVIGGYAFKTLFVDADGYLLTGDVTQHNAAPDEWVPYEADAAPGTRSFDCAACHTTGYRPDGHQDDRVGVVGTWDEAGVQCERCHGPGSAHAQAPRAARMFVDRSAAGCGECHIGDADDPMVLDAEGGFLRHQQQWSELYSSKKRVMDCVDCHDPHASARHVDAVLNPARGLRGACEDCHQREALVQNSRAMPALGVTCVDCHMPYAVRSAVGDADTHTADMRSHLFAIHPEPTAPQFDAEGVHAQGYLGTDFACAWCHREGGSATVKTEEELRASALGYHLPR